MGMEVVLLEVLAESRAAVELCDAPIAPRRIPQGRDGGFCVGLAVHVGHHHAVRAQIEDPLEPDGLVCGDPHDGDDGRGSGGLKLVQESPPLGTVLMVDQ